jgi:hypothetical protein
VEDTTSWLNRQISSPVGQIVLLALVAVLKLAFPQLAAKVNHKHKKHKKHRRPPTTPGGASGATC